MTKGAQRLGTEICGYCKWWNPSPSLVQLRREKSPIEMYPILERHEDAECRARAPKAMKYQLGNSRPYWPKTNGRDWCRKYETGCES
jgi:hypothetical protein